MNNLRRLLLRALNKNQILLLYEISVNECKTISSLIREISKKFLLPISTLKFNAKTLRNLDLINFGNGLPVKLTCTGKIVLEIISNQKIDFLNKRLIEN